MAFEERPLSQEFSVSPQVEPEDATEIIAAGFKSIINNRPDGEMIGQPVADELAQTLQDAGLDVRNIPMSPGQLSPQMIAEMADALANMPKPILAFCASGTRSAILWCCANVQDQGVDAVLSAVSNVGYDLEQIRPLLNQLSQ